MGCEDNIKQNQCPQETPNHQHLYIFLTTPSCRYSFPPLSPSFPTPDPSLFARSFLRASHLFFFWNIGCCLQLYSSACIRRVSVRPHECFCHFVHLDLKFLTETVSWEYLIWYTYQHDSDIILLFSFFLTIVIIKFKNLKQNFYSLLTVLD